MKQNFEQIIINIPLVEEKEEYDHSIYMRVLDYLSPFCVFQRSNITSNSKFDFNLIKQLINNMEKTKDAPSMILQMIKGEGTEEKTFSEIMRVLASYNVFLACQKLIKKPFPEGILLLIGISLPITQLPIQVIVSLLFSYYNILISSETDIETNYILTIICILQMKLLTAMDSEWMEPYMIDSSLSHNVSSSLDNLNNFWFLQYKDTPQAYKSLEQIARRAKKNREQYFFGISPAKAKQNIYLDAFVRQLFPILGNVSKKLIQTFSESKDPVNPVLSMACIDMLLVLFHLKHVFCGEALAKTLTKDGLIKSIKEHIIIPKDSVKSPKKKCVQLSLDIHSTLSYSISFHVLTKVLSFVPFRILKHMNSTFLNGVSKIMEQACDSTLAPSIALFMSEVSPLYSQLTTNDLTSDKNVSLVYQLLNQFRLYPIWPFDTLSRGNLNQSIVITKEQLKVDICNYCLDNDLRPIPFVK